jgi:hypothetical protein
MGLTIHYNLSTGEKDTDKVKQMVKSLREACMDLPFKEVGELFEKMGKDVCDWTKYEKDDPLRWPLIQCVKHIDRPYPKEYPDSTVYSKISYGVSPIHVIGFTAWPGEECEESNFGLVKFPRYRYTKEYGRIEVPEYNRWSWSSFCKTQYANDPRCGGVENFLRCHLVVVAALEKAKALGFEIDVSDEGHYWEKRDIKALIKEIGEWDAMIAGMNFALSNALDSSKSKMKMVTAMDGRPDRERLEMLGFKNQNLQKLVNTLEKEIKKENK